MSGASINHSIGSAMPLLRANQARAPHLCSDLPTRVPLDEGKFEDLLGAVRTIAHDIEVVDEEARPPYTSSGHSDSHEQTPSLDNRLDPPGDPAQALNAMGVGRDVKRGAESAAVRRSESAKDTPSAELFQAAKASHTLIDRPIIAPRLERDMPLPDRMASNVQVEAHHRFSRPQIPSQMLASTVSELARSISGPQSPKISGTDVPSIREAPLIRGAFDSTDDASESGSARALAAYPSRLAELTQLRGDTQDGVANGSGGREVPALDNPVMGLAAGQSIQNLGTASVAPSGTDASQILSAIERALAEQRGNSEAASAADKRLPVSAAPLKLLQLDLIVGGAGKLSLKLALSDAGLSVTMSANQVEIARQLEEERTLLLSHLKSSGYDVVDLVIETTPTPHDPAGQTAVGTEAKSSHEKSSPGGQSRSGQRDLAQSMGETGQAEPTAGLGDTDGVYV